MKNIILTPNWFPNKYNLSNGDFIQYHARIIGENNNVYICYAQSSEFQDQQFELVSFRDVNSRVVICYYKKSLLPILGKGINLIKYLIAHSKTIFIAKKELKNVDFFFVNVLTKCAIIPFYYKIKNQIPYYITEHSSYHINKQPKTIEYFLRKKIQKFLIQKSNGISVVSNTLKKALLEKGFFHSNFPVIPNVVNDDVFSFLIKKRTGKIKFLHVSSLDNRSKNVFGILEAFSLAVLNNNELELHIVGGEGSDLKKAKDYTKSLNIEKNVVFFGIKDVFFLKEKYNDSDCFVMFSNYETQSIVTLEALMCGLPVISSEIPAIMEYLSFDNSYLVKVGDVEGLSKKMLDFANGRLKRLDREDISLSIKEKFNNNLLREKFEVFFDKKRSF